MKRTSTRFALTCASLVALLPATSAVAELSHDVRQLSGMLAEQATRASLTIDSHSEAVRIKGVLEDALNDLARANNLIAVTDVQTFADKKQIGIGFVTISKPPVIIQIAARNGELQIEHASCGDETLVSYDSRTEANKLAEKLKQAAATASRLDRQQAERVQSELELAVQSAKCTLEMMHEPRFCSITAKRPGLTIHAWALEGEASSHVSTD
jgi:hypothetical protein